MALFGKKKEEAKGEKSCCCGNSQSASEVTSTCCGEKVDGICCIKVLGSGCKSCHQLYENTLKAVEGSGIEVEYITDTFLFLCGVVHQPHASEQLALRHAIF